MKTELEILRETVQHYAENGYSKAIKALKQIEAGKDEKKTLMQYFKHILAEIKK
jgi:hypothetical protein